MKNQHRFTVLVGGGISELYDAKQDLTFKQAVTAWVRGQKARPTDCVILLDRGSFAEECPDPYERTWIELEEEHEARELEVIGEMVKKHRSWVEEQLLKQNVYNSHILNYNQPFSRG